MHLPRQVRRLSGHFILTAIGALFTAQASAQVPLRPPSEVLAAASPELVDRLRADPFTYFRFINRAWTARVCAAFADVRDPAIVRLHGDAHVEQFAVTRDAWGLGDFDDSARGPVYIDIVRFLGSLDLAARQRGWSRERDALWDRFFDGYRRGLTEPDYEPPVPEVVRRLRSEPPVTRPAFLAWGETLMQPMEEAQLKTLAASMPALDRLVRPDRPDLAPGYFTVVRAGWLRIGVGSAAARKALIRVQGPSADADDDVLLEAKEVATLDGISCLQDSPKPHAHRIVRGSQQMGRLKHEILAVGPTLLVPAIADRAQYWLEWWVTSWDPSYREVRLTDLRNSEDLGAIAYDAGLQLGTGATVDGETRQRVLASMDKFEVRLRDATSLLVDELLAGWRELSGRRAASEAARAPR